MKDPRVEKLARVLVEYSCALVAGERVLIEGVNVPHEIVVALVRAAKRVGATPLVTLKDDRIIRELCATYDEAAVQLMADCELYTLRQVQAFIGLRGIENAQEYAGLAMQHVLRHYIQPVHLDYKNERTKWVALRWPTAAMAERAELSTEAFEDFFFDVCAVDYAQMERAMTPLCDLLSRTARVRILGPGETDLSFSIKGMGQYKSAGHHNMPDGELFTAPVRDSVAGRIRYNVPSVFYGTAFTDVCLDFKAGRVVHATAAADTRRLNELLDVDEGARYVGEFAFGLHPRITRPMRDILFDEKIADSVHLAQGNAYRVCDNGNRSAIHWDLILRQTQAVGGGEIYFDDVVVRRDGRFVLAELAGLNPENLA